MRGGGSRFQGCHGYLPSGLWFLLPANLLGNSSQAYLFVMSLNRLPSNREDAVKHLKSTRRTLEKKPLMKQHYFDFMLEKGHAEPAPKTELSPSTPRWYLPHFGVYHPPKPDKICVVFDSAAETKGTSLNKVLLSGPGLINNLLGVLLRFRQDIVGFVGDIEQMFHSF